MTVYQAKRRGIANFSLLVSHVLVPPAIAAIMESPTCRVQAFLAAGHVCTRDGHRRSTHRSARSTGSRSSSPASSRWTSSRESGARCSNWNRAGTSSRTPIHARSGPRATRPPRRCCGRLRRDRPGVARHRHDPEQRLAALACLPRLRRRGAVLGRPTSTPRSRALCRSGEVLQGLIKPHECAAFGKECTPRNPLGATMVSSEGACAAYYLYRRLEVEANA